MSLPGGLKARALLGLAVSQVLLLLAGILGGAAIVAGAGALAAVVAGLVWWRREREAILYGAAAAGALTTLAPLQQPLDLPTRGAVGLGVIALVAFFEYGHLAHRAAGLDRDTLDEETEAAMRGRLTRVLAWTSLATLGVVALTAVPGPWFADAFAISVERSGPVGVLLAGGAIAGLAAGIARLRRAWAERGDGADAEA